MNLINESPADLPSDQILGFACELAIEDVILNRAVNLKLSVDCLLYTSPSVRCV